MKAKFMRAVLGGVFMVATLAACNQKVEKCQVSSCSEAVYKDGLCADHYVSSQVSGGQTGNQNPSVEQGSNNNSVADKKEKEENEKQAELQNEVNKLKEKFSSLKTGDKITFGAYEQDTNFSNGAEGIEWHVLDVNNGKVLLLSTYILEGKKYDETNKLAKWSDCSLRKWLNDEFYNTAFNDTEKKFIELSKLSTPNNEYFNTTGGKDTEDWVFLLSLPEVKKYFKLGEIDVSEASFLQPFDKVWYWNVGDDRILAHATKKTYEVGLYLKTEYEGVGYSPAAYGQWYLRSPGMEAELFENPMMVFGGVGGVDANGRSGYTDKGYVDGVRPAIWININTVGK